MPEVLKLTPEKGAVVPINEDPTDGGRAYDYTPGYLGQQVVNVSTGSVYVATGVTPSNWLLIGGGAGGAISVTDGSTTVDPATSIDFSGATVTDEGGGVAGVAVSGSGPEVVVTVVNFDDPDLLTTGKVLYVPEGGEVVVTSCSYGSIPTTVFDGTGPVLVIGSQGEDLANENNYLGAVIGSTLDSPVGSHASGVQDIGVQKYRLLDTNPVVVVLTDGSGGDPGCTQGQAIIGLLILPPPA